MIFYKFIPQNPQNNYKTYGRDALQKALDAVKNGEHIRKISKKYGVPRATLQRLKKLGHVSDPQPHNKFLSPTEEESLVNYINWMAASNFPITNKVLKVTVQGIIKKREIPVVLVRRHHHQDGVRDF